MHRARLGGFTLLELILVMMLICIMLAAAAPDLHNFFSGQKLNDSAARLVSVTQWCRSQAISDGRIYRLNIGSGNYSVTMQDQDNFVDTGSSFGQAHDLEDGVQMTLNRQDNLASDHVDFYPQGTTDPGEIRMMRQNQEEIRVVCWSPTEPFHVAAANENASLPTEQSMAQPTNR